jgi:hypothetical protein
MHPERSRSHGPGGLKRCSACGEEKRADAFPPELAWSAPLLVDSFTTAALDSAGGNGHRTPAALAIAQDHTPGADQEAATAPDARQRVRALIAREHAGGPQVTAAEVVAVTGRSRRRAYELLRDARTEHEQG